jgi:hypothetical protein
MSTAPQLLGGIAFLIIRVSLVMVAGHAVIAFVPAIAWIVAGIILVAWSVGLITRQERDARAKVRS